MIEIFGIVVITLCAVFGMVMVLAPIKLLFMKTIRCPICYNGTGLTLSDNKVVKCRACGYENNNEKLTGEKDNTQVLQ